MMILFLIASKFETIQISDCFVSVSFATFTLHPLEASQVCAQRIIMLSPPPLPPLWMPPLSPTYVFTIQPYDCCSGG